MSPIIPPGPLPKTSFAKVSDWLPEDRQIHRLTRPRYDASTDTLHTSTAELAEPIPWYTSGVLKTLEALKLVRLTRGVAPKAATSNGHAGSPTNRITSTTNLTILNYLLVHLGPLHERTLCLAVAGIQLGCSALAFGIRYGMASWVYGGNRR